MSSSVFLIVLEAKSISPGSKYFESTKRIAACRAVLSGTTSSDQPMIQQGYDDLTIVMPSDMKETEFMAELDSVEDRLPMPTTKSWMYEAGYVTNAIGYRFFDGEHRNLNAREIILNSSSDLDLLELELIPPKGSTSLC